MQTILILGASSVIGAALAKEFSRGNRIILSGRNQKKLINAACKCKELGSVDIKIIAADLGKSTKPIFDLNHEWPIDLIIDAASVTSSFRDWEIGLSMFSEIIEADLISHLNLFNQIFLINSKFPKIIFVTTILTILKTREREIYYSLKRMIEIYLEKLIGQEKRAEILIFRIGSLINSGEDNVKAELLAKKVKREFSKGVSVASYGAAFKLLIILKKIHPALLDFVIGVQRLIRQYVKPPAC